MTVEMTREEALDFFSEFYGGEHHCPKLRDWGLGWCVLEHADLATFDFTGLSRLVFMAHDRCIRVSVQPCNMQYVRIALHKREREGSLMERHPTLEQAVAAWRETHKEPTP